MNNDQLKIAIVEPSVIIRSGITVVLKRIPGYRIQPIEIISVDSMNHYLNIHKPDILIINPSFWGYFDISKIKTETSNTKLKCLALVYSAIDESLLRNYDNTISIYDSVEQLKEKLDKILDSPVLENSEEQNTLSVREKEIITCVVKGLTNKEIAQALFLSAHTVISHRRNIARKLEIHSTAGLTIYAIMNKLIEIDEIKRDTQI
ncbi:MAG TPA: response regulator transcription factor [Paludibacter sp.]|nr:response regulator transcription factor [Paludibacter sp.]